MKKQNRRLTSFVIALCMILSLFQVAMPMASAESVSTGTIMTVDDWSGTGFTVNTSWGQFNYSDWGGSGKYIYNKYDFTGDFSFVSGQLNVYGNTAYILFCYQNDNNYYKLTLGTSNSLTKVVNGTSTTLATLGDNLSGTEMSVKIAHAADGTITVTRGAKGGNGEGTDIFEVVDTDLTHGKMGLGFQNSGGYFAIMNFSGDIASAATPSPAPTAAPTADPSSGSNYKTIYSQDFENISDAEKALWVNHGTENVEISGGLIHGANWTQPAIMLYEGQKFGSEDYLFSIDARDNVGASEGNSGSVLFGFNASGSSLSGYAVEIQGGTTGKVYLKKYTQDMWNNVQTVGTYVHTSSLQSKTVNVEVEYKSTGKATVYLTVGGTKYIAFSDVDVATTQGYVGVMKMASQFSFDNVKIGVPENSSITPAPTAAPTAAPTPTPDPNFTKQTVYEQDFTSVSDTEKALWVNHCTDEMEISDGKIHGADWTNPSVMLYEGQTFGAEDYIFTIDVNDNVGGSTGNTGRVLFNYTASGTAHKGYAVEFQGGDDGVVTLKKYTQDIWNNIETVATYTHTSSLKSKNVKVEVNYSAEGTVSVVLVIDGTRYNAFTAQIDPQYASGYIGVSKMASGFSFDNVKVEKFVEAATKTYSVTDPAVTRYLGRAKTIGSAARAYFPYCGFEFVVENVNTIQIEAKRLLDQAAYFGVFIDDSTDYTVCKVQPTTAQYYTAATLPDAGKHKVKIIKLDGQNSGLDFMSIKLYEAEEDASTIEPSKAKDRLIEFIGDSITVGYGLMDNVSTTENAYLAYSGQTATYFGADVNMAAISGAGFVATESEWGSIRPNTYYPYIYSWNKFPEENKWDFHTTPDVIVINLGTNGNENNTVDHYYNFVKQVRECNGDAQTKEIPIIVGQGPMSQSAMAHIREAVTRLNNEGDLKVYALGMGTGGNGGVDWHPTQAQAGATAAIIEAKITEITGWTATDNTKYAITQAKTEKSANSVAVTAKITNVTDNPVATANIIAAAYDANGVLVGVKITPATAVEGTAYNETIATSAAADEVNLMIWNMTSSQPLCEKSVR